MMKIGIAGGIGSGKSYVCARIRQRGFEVYDCDSAAKRLIRTAPDSRRQPAAIDAIVHPAVFRDFEASGLQWLESAIMYESGISRLMDRVIVVTAPLEVRIRRVMQRDSISRTQVLAWMGKQLPQEEVVARADFELVNDGEADIEQQLNNIIEQCNKPF